MDITLENIKIDGTVAVGDIISTKGKGMTFRDAHLLTKFDDGYTSRYFALSFDGYSKLNGSFSSIENLIKDLRESVLIESIHILSQEEYKLSVEKV